MTTIYLFIQVIQYPKEIHSVKIVIIVTTKKLQNVSSELCNCKLQKISGYQ